MHGHLNVKGIIVFDYFEQTAALQSHSQLPDSVDQSHCKKDNSSVEPEG